MYKGFLKSKNYNTNLYPVTGCVYFPQMRHKKWHQESNRIMKWAQKGVGDKN